MDLRGVEITGTFYINKQTEYGDAPQNGRKKQKLLNQCLNPF